MASAGAAPARGARWQRAGIDPVDVPVPVRGAVAMAIPGTVGTPDDPRRELLVLDVDGTRDTWWFADDDELATTPPALDVTVTPTTDGATVEVHARSLARELCLLADHVAPDATVDQALVTLLPGESATFRVTATPHPARRPRGPRAGTRAPGRQRLRARHRR